MYRVVKQFTFTAAHRLRMHKGKCYNLHGHTYKVEICFSAKQLNEQGTVLDFGYIKEIVGKWIDNYLDHSCILSRNDPIEIPSSLKTFRMIDPPTAENLAKRIHAEITIGRIIRCEWVRVWESSTSYAEYIPW